MLNGKIWTILGQFSILKLKDQIALNNEYHRVHLK